MAASRLGTLALRVPLTLWLPVLILASICGAGCPDPIPAASTTVYVVRHAEKEPNTLNELLGTTLPDPQANQTRPLSAEGLERALDLRDLLHFEGVRLDAVYSTATLRTWQTAAPALELVSSADPAVQIYASNAELEQQLRAQHSGQTVLVVGHSNTVGDIVQRLTSVPMPDSIEAYNQLFVVHIDEQASSLERRTYGVFPSAGLAQFSETEQGASGQPIKIERPWHISGVAVTEDGSLLIASDETEQFVQVMKRTGPSYVAQAPLELSEDKAGELDLEGVTRVRNSNVFYVVGSHSSRRKPIYGKHTDKTDEQRRERYEAESPDRESSREQLWRLELGADGQLLKRTSLDIRKLLRGNPVLKHFYNEKTKSGRRVAIPSKENGVDIEGIAHHDGKLYLGFRGPRLRWNFVPVLIVDPEVPNNTEVRYVQLDGRGIRDLVAVENGFLILAGATGDEPLSFQLYYWNGENCFPGEELRNSSNVVLLGTLPTAVGAKAEGLAVLNLDDHEADHHEVLVLHDGQYGGAPVRYRAPRISR